MFQRLGCNDAVLLTSLLYYSVDMISEWDTFAACSRPLHCWLLGSFVFLLGFRLSHLVGFWATAMTGTHATDGSIIEFMLDLRQKGFMPRLLLASAWAAVPLLALWAVFGTSWLLTVYQDSPQCLPSETYLWFSGIFLAVCYGWIVLLTAIGVKALLLERNVRRAECRLREVESEDVLRRWGPIGHISSHVALESDLVAALSPSLIKSLPFELAPATAVQECSICLCEVEPGDGVRRLPGCGHAFHSACIDIWLLRRADCPLCKQDVAAAAESDAVSV